MTNTNPGCIPNNYLPAGGTDPAYFFATAHRGEHRLTVTSESWAGDYYAVVRLDGELVHAADGWREDGMIAAKGMLVRLANEDGFVVD